MAEQRRSDAQAHEPTAADIEEERISFQKIVNTFALYRQYGYTMVRRLQTQYERISERHRELLPNYRLKLSGLLNAVECNAQFVNQFIVDAASVFGPEDANVEEENQIEEADSKQHLSSSSASLESNTKTEEPTDTHRVDDQHPHPCSDQKHDSSSHHSLDGDAFRLPQDDRLQPTASDMSKLKSTIRQFVRDWSAEGAKERELCYGPLVEVLTKTYPPEIRRNIRVLSPGSGLGRLPWEVAKLGFSSQGNEFSFFMLIPSNILLNCISEPHSHKIYPYIHSSSNIMEVQDQLRPVTIPDVSPRDLPPGSDFSMCGGEFVEVYGAQLSAWDCVLTPFFIDTAHNVITYVETIYDTLKPGGIWVNQGPLLYHYEDMSGEPSLELSYEEIRHIILKTGFSMVEEQRRSCPYTSDGRSMFQVVYECIFFVAVKPRVSEAH